MAFGANPLVSLADARSKRDEAYSVLCEGLLPQPRPAAFTVSLCAFAFRT